MNSFGVSWWIASVGVSEVNEHHMRNEHACVFIWRHASNALKKKTLYFALASHALRVSICISVRPSFSDPTPVFLHQFGAMNVSNMRCGINRATDVSNRATTVQIASYKSLLLLTWIWHNTLLQCTLHIERGRSALCQVQVTRCHSIYLLFTNRGLSIITFHIAYIHGTAVCWMLRVGCKWGRGEVSIVYKSWMWTRKGERAVRCGWVCDHQVDKWKFHVSYCRL